MSHIETYTRLLLSTAHGYPLWIPEPNNTLPADYISSGVRIGDVGIVTGDGTFDYLFNVCEPADHAVNRNRVPEGFVPVAWDVQDLMETENRYPPRAIIRCEAESTLALNAGASMEIPATPAFVGGEMEFKFSKSCGAMLTLPDGTTRLDYQNRRAFRDYAISNARRWYEYAIFTRGREPENGSLYLVTGTDKACTWANAAFSDPSPDTDITIKLSSNYGKFSVSRRSFSHNLCATRYHSPSTGRNQAVFIRGFKIMLRKGILARIKGPVKITNIVQSKGKDVTSRGKDATFSGFGSSPSGSGQSNTVHNSVTGRSVSHNAGKDEIDSNSSGPGLYSDPLDSVVSESVSSSDSETSPSSSESDILLDKQLYHPSNAINEYILESNPDVDIAITHDDDWCSVLDESESRSPDDNELIQRMKARYRILTSHEGAFFGSNNTRGDTLPTNDIEMTTSRSRTDVSPHLSDSYTSNYAIDNDDASSFFSTSSTLQNASASLHDADDASSCLSTSSTLRNASAPVDTRGSRIPTNDDIEMTTSLSRADVSPHLGKRSHGSAFLATSEDADNATNMSDGSYLLRDSPQGSSGFMPQTDDNDSPNLSMEEQKFTMSRKPTPASGRIKRNRKANKSSNRRQSTGMASSDDCETSGTDFEADQSALSAVKAGPARSARSKRGAEMLGPSVGFGMKSFTNTNSTVSQGAFSASGGDFTIGYGPGEMAAGRNARSTRQVGTPSVLAETEVMKRGEGSGVGSSFVAAGGNVNVRQEGE